MSSTSQKHMNFATSPMGDKPVTALPGIGVANGNRLNEAGYDKAYQVVGHYLEANKNQVAFKDWVQYTASANSKQANDCYKGVRDYSNSFI